MVTQIYFQLTPEWPQGVLRTLTVIKCIVVSHGKQLGCAFQQMN